MEKEFRAEGEPVNVDAMIEEARGQVVATGAGDSEFESLEDTRRRFHEGIITAKQARDEVMDLLGSRQDYH